MKNTSKTFNTVVVDAGHGGNDTGAYRRYGPAEKLVALDVAQRLDHKLRESQIKTVMTRSSDVFIPLDDRVAIENHPLAAYFLIPPESKQRRADAIRQLILDEIEHLKPADSSEIQWQSPEWRPFLILSKRYIEAEDPAEIARSLYIGDRQFRRDHSRALQALSARMWESHFAAPQTVEAASGGETEEQQDFEFHPEILDLREVIEGVALLTARRFESEKGRLEIELSEGPLEVFTDRVALRQILLNLLNYVTHMKAEPVIHFQVRTSQGLAIKLSFETDDQWNITRAEEQDTLIFVRRLSTRIPARIEEDYPPPGQAGEAAIYLVFADRRQKTILMVDDQPATLKMFQRYLSGTGLEVTGLSDPGQAVETARRTHPALILLDVMMPRIDGWEVLQALQLDPQTRRIPIVVCSAWGEPELARSLGALEFLKKPVIQKDLLAVLTRLGMIQD